jgi:hypothetical protein
MWWARASRRVSRHSRRGEAGSCSPWRAHSFTSSGKSNTLAAGGGQTALG